MRKSQPLVATSPEPKVSIIPSRTVEAKEAVEAAKFELGQEDRNGGSFADVDEGLADLPSGYAGLCYAPRSAPAYTYWDVSMSTKKTSGDKEGNS